ncbi:hypothetical protein SAMN05421686_109161 [Thalassolituus maritimus]|uniref:Competence protein CoiA-like family protein n=1 Tax=Thalassolituus maritimus TaxID=484498 RepID=A0A1N7PFZ7_9GAMM|nr:DUF6035 family protein [Thalassolituus maritimus]SIT09511.1 hypothetical protein SAMN05421686_109161 [Thalassolituus maritimus]
MQDPTELKRTISTLINFDTGKEESAIPLIAVSEAAIFQLRRKIEERIQDNNFLYGCSECGQPVVIRSHRTPSGGHTFYFKHLHDSGDCPIKTESKYTKDEVRRMKYNGAKESKPHLDLKNYIASQLRKDERFKNIKVENVIKGSGWSKRWKKPDISAEFNGKIVVFEIQLSTTFLDVIVSREVFYKNEGISIFWIFSNLDPNKARATEKDVFFNNKSNALSVDRESKEMTYSQGKLILTGHFKRQYFDFKSKIITDHWETMPVSFDIIKFDPYTYKPYFINFDENHQQTLNDKRNYEAQYFIKIFEAISLEDDPSYTSRRECAVKLISIGLYDNDDLCPGFLKFIKALLSVRDGKIHFPNQVGKWTWLVNYVWEHHTQHWLVFLYTVNVYDRTEIVFDKHNQKLNEKRARFKKNWKTDPKFEQSSKYYPLFMELLPKLKGKLIMSN